MPVNTCGVGGWGGPLPGDPSNNSLLTATAEFGGIRLSWNLPSTNPFAVAYVRVFRSFNSSFVTAIQIAEAAGGGYFDPSETIQLHYYWIQLISVNGTDGAVIGPATATPNGLIADMLSRLSGMIDESSLATNLRNNIDRIDLNESAILAEANARIASNTAYQAMLLQLQTGVADALTLVNTEVTQRTNGDSALASVLTTVAAANVNNAALIQEETLARVSADSAIASQYTLLNAQVNNATTGLPATRSLLMNDYYTEAQVDSAIASATLNLVSQTGLTAALGSYTTTAALQVAYYTKTQTDSAISSASTTLQSSINSNHTTAMNAANAAQTSANTANSLLADISSDSLLTSSEKPAVVKEYNILIGEQAGISAQATSYGITTEAATYTTALSALTTYVNGLTGWNVIPGSNVAIVGATFRTNFQNVYAARQALLNAILAASKTLTGTAQTTANNAATAASTAQTAANTANTAHANLASDNILSPSEKPSVVQDHGVIIAEQAGITAQATSYGITTELTAYTNAVSALVSYLGGLTGWNTVPGVDVVIVGTTFRTQFSNVYTTRQTVLNAIAARAKVLADNAQTAANNAQGTANTVTSTLSNNYTTTVGMNSAISSAITTLESSVDGDLVSLQSSLTTNIGAVQTDLNGVKSNLNAQYLLRLNVNGLVGGMGIYNNGTSVDVGFTADNFFIGSTQANKIAPFIVTGGVVYMKEAVIQDGTIGSAKIADNISSTNYTETGATSSGWAISKLGNAIFNQVSVRGQINTGEYIGYAWPIAVAGRGTHLSNAGLLMGNYFGTQGYFQYEAATGYLSIGFAGQQKLGLDSSGNLTINGTLTAGAVNAVNTINIAGNAVTVPTGVNFSSVAPSITITPSSASTKVMVIVNIQGTLSNQNGGVSFVLARNGVAVAGQDRTQGNGVLAWTDNSPGTAAVTYSVSESVFGDGGGGLFPAFSWGYSHMLVMEVKR